MAYRDHLIINKGFQASVNLELDLGNPAKIGEYIPTTDICDVLKVYARAILGDTSARATTLIGPYGKGKSFLLLVLSYMVSGRFDDNTYKRFKKKIGKVDTELVHLMEEIEERKVRLLPVVINANYDSLSQSFMLALNDALTREGITDLVPETVYTVCIDLIDKWAASPETQQNTLGVCTEKFGMSLQQLRRELNECSPEAYEKFRRLYNCVTTGLEFNPLINKNVCKTFSAVNHELTKKGYSGMFIIFDEFSKFVEGCGDTLMQEMKIVQDFAEFAVRSNSAEQVHFCCVTHKNLELYGDDAKKVDSFKTVEGRFKEIRFNRSLEENYQIISSAIAKDKEAEKMIGKFQKEHKDFYDAVKKSQAFASMTEFGDLFDGCFPLNPMTVYALIQMSEIIAQNERTLFTFISDTDDNSLNSFIQTNDSGMFNVDKIYDYFSPLMQKEATNSIRNIWYRAEGTLSHVEDNEKRKLIKALAVILMINDNDRFAPDAENIALCEMMNSAAVQQLLDKMIDEHYLRKGVINGVYGFSSSNSKEIEEQISIISKTKLKSASVDTIMDEVNEEHYILPRRYNVENKITRFYRVVHLSEERFMELKSFKVLKNAEFSDGIVINLLRKDIPVKDIEGHYQEMVNDEKSDIIVRYSKNGIDSYFVEEALRYAALSELLARGGNDSVVNSEIELMREEVSDDLGVLLDKYFDSEDCRFVCTSKNSKTFESALSTVMDDIYTECTYFNNELVNKNDVTTQYQKSVNNVVRWILSGANEEEFAYSASSAESSIKNTIVNPKMQNDKYELHTKNVRAIIEDIKTNIVDSEKKKFPLASLVTKYHTKPYGIRIGVLPILFAMAISELSDNVLLYMKGQEIDLNPENLVKAIRANNENYLIGFSKGSKEQSKYLYEMLDVFRVPAKKNFREDTLLLNAAYKRFFAGLPMIVRNSSKVNSLEIPEEICRYQQCFVSVTNNPYEQVFEKAQSSFETTSYKKISKYMQEFVNGWKLYLNAYKTKAKEVILQSFGIPEEMSIHMGIKAYLSSIGVGEDTKLILDEQNNRIFTCLNNLDFDDAQSVDSIILAATGAYAEDWTHDRLADLSESLGRFISTITAADRIEADDMSLKEVISKSTSVEISGIGKSMESSLEEIIDEYAGSVTTEEKIAILSGMLQKLL